MPKEEKQVGNWKVTIIHRGYYGFFENQVTGCEGGIWLEGRKVVEYDGTHELPKNVAQVLQELGYEFDEHILPD